MSKHEHWVDVDDEDGDYMYSREIVIPSVFDDDDHEASADTFICDPSGLPISFPFAKKRNPVGFQPRPRL